jgi:hypothetical protein
MTAGLGLVLALGLSAQVTTTKPIRVKQPKVATEKYKGVIVTWTPVSITVRPKESHTLLRTFSFDEALQRRVENHYMENGDPVTVYVRKGSETAVKLSGKIRRYEAPSRLK